MLNKKESTKEYNRVKKLIEQRENWNRTYYDAVEKAAMNARKKAQTKKGRTKQRRQLEAQELQRLTRKEEVSKKRKLSTGFIDGVQRLEDWDQDEEEREEHAYQDECSRQKDPETVSRSSSMLERPLSSVLWKQSQVVPINNDNSSEDEDNLNETFDVEDGGSDGLEDGPIVTKVLSKAERQRQKMFGKAPRVRDIPKSQGDKTVDASISGKPIQSKSYIRADSLYYLQQMCKLQGQSIEIETLRNAQTSRTFAVS